MMRRYVWQHQSPKYNMITMDIHEMKTIKVMKMVKRTDENMQNTHQSRLSDANILYTDTHTHELTHHKRMNELNERKITFQTEHSTFESVLIRSPSLPSENIQFGFNHFCLYPNAEC